VRKMGFFRGPKIRSDRGEVYFGSGRGCLMHVERGPG
jgi:hypothetical protein